MSDVALAREILSQIYEATQTIQRRFQLIRSPLDFTVSPGSEVPCVVPFPRLSPCCC